MYFHDRAARSKYGDNLSQARISNSIEDILVAASSGAVETLFIDPSVKRTGSFDADQLAVHIDDQPREENEDLVNLAATIVLRNSGAVMPLSGDIPSGGMAAIMRYAFPPPIEQMSTASQTQPRR